jgi:serine/threonine-protein kinase
VGIGGTCEAAYTVLVTDALPDRLQADLGPGFVIQRELGGGGMSRVFVADELALDRRVVVKVLAPELAAGVNVERFRREIQLAAALQHPHIVPVLATGEVADAPGSTANVLPYFTMPYIEGDSLRVQLEQSGAMPLGAAVAILRDVAKGLAHAHAHGIVHRDIKPENILLSGGSAAVTDFGVAKALASARRSMPGGGLTVVGMSLGTPAYMAPEQAAGDPATDHRADLYALGLIGYEMLAGRGPFGARSPQALIAAHMTEKPAALSRRRKDVPPGLAALVMRCLEKDPALRPQSAEEFLTALDASPAGMGRRSRITLAAIALVGISALVVVWRTLPAERSGTPAMSAIAVLPLVNTSGDPRDEYFSDGLTDELASALTRVNGLRVASRTSTFAFKGRRDVDVREIGRRLGVGAVLEGTVRRDGRRLRLAAQLTNTTDGLSLWSDSYAREVEDIFAVQDELAGAIVTALAPRLTLPGNAAPSAAAPGGGSTRRTTDLEAYDLYLRGRYYWHQRGDSALRVAATLFEQAIARDPGFAAAHAGLADALALLPVYGATSADSALPLARVAAERAIALDSTLAEAHTTLGLVHKSLGEWDRAERTLARALALDPESSAAHQWRGEVLVITGRMREAAAALRTAHQLDPLSPIIAAELGYMLTLAGESDAGVAMGRRAIALAPQLWTVHAFLGSSFLFAGRVAEAIPPLERAVELDRNVSLFRGVLAYAYARNARPADARRLLSELEQEAGRGGAASPVSIAYVGLGDTVRALDWLERAAAAKDPYLLAMSLTATWFDPLRGDPRFAPIARTLGLDPAIMARPTGR